MTTCQKHGDRSRKKMTGTFMKGRWDTFLRNSQSKDSLILLISDCIKSRLFPGLKASIPLIVLNLLHSYIQSQ